MLTSVVIPVHNGAAYLEEAVASIETQTYPHVEIVVVDDGSTDGTPALATSLGTRIRYFRQANAGPAAALNRGVREAGGDLIAFLSADDVWVPEKLAWQIAALQADPGIDAVFGHMLHFVSPEIEPARAATLHCPADPMPAFSAGTMLAPIGIFARVGPLDETFRTGEFLDWYGRANDLGLRLEMLPQTVSRRRVHGSNHSLTGRAPQSYTRVLKAALDRRRRQEGAAG